MSKIDWEFIISILFVPLIFFSFLVFIIYMSKTDSNLENEKYKICIEAGMQWQQGNCIEKNF